jgi:hypothetical protein
VKRPKEWSVMALSERQAEQVAKERERSALAAGDSPAKAKRHADEVRAYARRERGEKAK